MAVMGSDSVMKPTTPTMLTMFDTPTCNDSPSFADISIQEHEPYSNAGGNKQATGMDVKSVFDSSSTDDFYHDAEDECNDVAHKNTREYPTRSRAHHSWDEKKEMVHQFWRKIVDKVMRVINEHNAAHLTLEFARTEVEYVLIYRFTPLGILMMMFGLSFTTIGLMIGAHELTSYMPYDVRLALRMTSAS
ncbi:uncharacterized protein LAESUDRAFT_713671 [Laetiporus sulphureus 93-53]|uniref:Uncharacterized protein n=1 Tax=Laetiporus sulphureus 93-53 TaxID=1314785 RepID=A0A165EJ89_9APHY|nr:uncharacterized protein LAESUDRAFT_713671 [Laetiporus sulphureus 93-53]KZT07165.1 hypothetical protein LAESUDRAFT_713671 [Laetiporus sulphureus 93-53]